MIDQNNSDKFGFITLQRKLQDNWLWLSEPFTKAQAWVDLIFLANHKDSSFFLRGIKVDVKRGQLARGEVALSQRWKWSREKLRNFLKLLETEQQIRQHKTNKINVIEIINYDLHQRPDNKPDNRKTSNQTTNQTHKNNVNNENNENNYKYLVEGLKFVLEAKMNKKIITSKWNDEFRKLIDTDLKNRPNAIEDVKRAIQAISDNYGKEYFPVIQSASSLREKLSKVENYLAKNSINPTNTIFISNLNKIIGKDLILRLEKIDKFTVKIFFENKVSFDELANHAKKEEIKKLISQEFSTTNFEFGF